MKTKGRFLIHVRSVATLGARLEWRVDGQTLQTADLPDLDKKNDSQAREYDKTITFPIPPGRHKITLDNTGGDWLSADWVAFEGSFE